MKRKGLQGRYYLLLTIVCLMSSVSFAQNKPNILVIFGDDVGLTNISAYGQGVVGYMTPNLDKLAHSGLMFTDYYAENSCTAGRSTFITGQCAKRTGMSKVGIPGAPVGLQDRDITIAQALKPLGYATAQFGKNHLGDRDEFLPTRHGFDEFFGNLYHLNAEEEPEHPTWPKDDPAFTKANSPRGVIHSTADGKVEDTGPLTIKRMETIDDETTSACMEFIKKQAQNGKPFFTWMNFTRMHFKTHVRPSMLNRAGMPGNFYADGMLELDDNVGKLMKLLDDLKLTDNTIVVFTTDNGPNQFSWPDAATTPFRSEKNTNWEGAYRVPAFVRWPGHIQPGGLTNQMFSGMDWFPTLLAAAGNANIKDELLNGKNVGGKTFKVHLDGYNQLDFITGKTDKSARTEFPYFNDDAQLVAFRYQDWKMVVREQPKVGGFEVWSYPFTTYRVPKVFNLRMDPFERADLVSDNYYQWLVDNDYKIGQISTHAVGFLETFIKYPPSQLPASFSVDGVEEDINKATESNMKHPSMVTQPDKK
ncbi:arylsulfatase [Danxiaibacter flavus]|uniref:Arylsulfatase n=1 Tax=Danxiaibacter flavus TaxID=3049108 RepID=A0ABV3Z972_9BACT|nr:arylsulfatase [Chitinophagaceae bacterium DXS]